METFGNFLDAAARPDGAHDQPQGQSDGNTENQDDNGHQFHKFSLSKTTQLDAVQCAPVGGFVASGNAVVQSPSSDFIFIG